MLSIKRFSWNYDNWKCILDKTYRQMYITEPFFQGYAGLLNIHKVSEPQVWLHNGEKLKVCEEGYMWLMFRPDYEGFCITAMLDQELQPIVWYIDVIGNKFDILNGVMTVEDLFLDFIVYSNGDVMEEDYDELGEALRLKIITAKQFNYVEHVKERIFELGMLDRKNLMLQTKKILRTIQKPIST